MAEQNFVIHKPSSSDMTFMVDHSREIVKLHANGDLTLNGKLYPLESQDQETVKEFVKCLKEFTEKAF